MRVLINQSDMAGDVTIPSSKSMTIRALMCAALAKGETEIRSPLVSDDTSAAADVLGKIGVAVRKENGVWWVSGGALRRPTEDLYCGESATTLRFMTAICSLIPGEHRLLGGPSLSKRPIRSLVEALKMLGIKSTLEGKTTPPVIVYGGTLKGGEAELPGHISSQFISALLLIAPFAQNEVSIKLTTPMTSRPYVLMTSRCMKEFGVNVTTSFDKFIVKRQRYRPVRFTVEGDWSSASYFLALGAVSEAGVKVENIRTSSIQGDRVILDFLRNMGAQVRVAGDSVSVSKGGLKAVKADLSDSIDLLPTMSVLAALADGVSEFTGIERARIKESNRISAMKEGLTKTGTNVSEKRDRIFITGLMTEDASKKTDSEEDMEDEDEDDSESGESGEAKEKPGDVPEEPRIAVVDSYNDHRIAMAFGVLGAARGGIVIDGAECVSKTYPGFWNSLKGIGGRLEIDAK
jgi:3-phosphoshikimate 1-carboxyvinyltransferase